MEAKLIYSVVKVLRSLPSRVMYLIGGVVRYIGRYVDRYSVDISSEYRLSVDMLTEYRLTYRPWCMSVDTIGSRPTCHRHITDTQLIRDRHLTDTSPVLHRCFMDISSIG